jgi:hypothetical protein
MDACRSLLRGTPQKDRRETYDAETGRQEGRNRSRVSWPETLGAMRAWLEPYVKLWRYCRAFSEKPPPLELSVLLERVFSGRGLYLYAR